MKLSKIDWCDITWNPVTGCLHNCEYCYARGIAKRFGAHLDTDNLTAVELHQKGENPYPYDFFPTYHRYRLGDPMQRIDPQTIFVCSMADLFGEWVPDEWIREVFNSCIEARQHKYLFLTKNPARYHDLRKKGILPTADNFWFGFSITKQSDLHKAWADCAWMDYNTFVSIEPLHGPVDIEIENRIRWVIVGAETGNSKTKVIPQREWIEDIVDSCHDAKVPLFMKRNLTDVWGEPLIQEYPW